MTPSCPRLSRASTSCFVRRAKTWMAGTEPGHDRDRSSPPAVMDCRVEFIIGPRFARTRWLAMTPPTKKPPKGLFRYRELVRKASVRGGPDLLLGEIH